MTSPQKCCAISKDTRKQCKNDAKFITKENLHVCRYHKECTIEDIRIFYLNKELKLKKKEETEQKKLQKQLEKEKIELYNKKLLEEHPREIPLKDITGKIVNFALVDEEDYDKVMKYKWHQFKQKNDLIYAISHIDNKKVLMHHFILGKPENNDVIHHRDHNGLNNKRNNIVIVSLAVNNQHNFKSENCKSKYLGVGYSSKTTKKWSAQSSKVNLGLYSEEIEAAKIYDTYVYLKYGKEALTNGLVNYDDIKHIDINTLIYKKQRELPNNISKNKENTYRVRITYNGNNFISFEPTLDKAKDKLKLFEKEIENIKLKEKEEHFKKPIIRNELGQAIIIEIKIENGEIKNIIVDDDKWHELSLFKWRFDKHGYAIVDINKKTTYMHSYLLNTSKGDKIKHINKNKYDNRIENLELIKKK